MYQIEWTNHSQADYNKIDGSQKIIVDKAIEKRAQKHFEKVGFLPEKNHFGIDKEKFSKHSKSTTVRKIFD